MLEDLVIACQENKTNVDILVEGNDRDGYTFGARIRPWKNTPSNGRMVMGQGTTVEEAVSEAVSKAKAGRWERLDWSARPWTTGKGGGGW